MKGLGKSEEQPDRYKNRGGQLLKEEKERNRLKKLIPILEENLVMLTTDFYNNNGKPFLTWGETVEHYIHSLHEAQKAVSNFI